RKKDLFKTASGKYIAPQHLERLLTGRPLVEQACVIGDRRPYCVALIVPDLPALSDWARESGLDWRSTADLLRLPAVRERFGREVEAVNAELARHETLKKFDLLADPFTEAEGLLTPSQKVRRKQVLTRYAVEIEALYSESSGRLRMRIAG
ncbi:MAG: long-chain fatty acid--CoA ligase, partial [Myxococcales bacterium]|nr:long-chain fatty acid--CoA ligase [Myxococcales bacterium]